MQISQFTIKENSIKNKEPKVSVAKCQREN